MSFVDVNGITWSYAERTGSHELVPDVRLPQPCIVLVDPAAGVDDGRRAAEVIVRMVGEKIHSDADDLAETFEDADMRLAIDGVDSQASAMAIAAGPGAVTIVSGGDCEAWLVAPGREPVELTLLQQRRPRFGATGVATVSRAAVPPGSIVLAGTDGFWLQVRRSEILAWVGRGEACTADAILDAMTDIERDAAVVLVSYPAAGA